MHARRCPAGLHSLVQQNPYTEVSGTMAHTRPILPVNEFLSVLLHQPRPETVQNLAEVPLRAAVRLCMLACLVCVCNLVVHVRVREFTLQHFSTQGTNLFRPIENKTITVHPPVQRAKCESHPWQGCTQLQSLLCLHPPRQRRKLDRPSATGDRIVSSSAQIDCK